MTTLVPTTRLVCCPACDEHVKAGEASCPHCGAGLAGARPVSDEPGLLGEVTAVYGVPATRARTEPPDEPIAELATLYGMPATNDPESGRRPVIVVAGIAVAIAVIAAAVLLLQ